MACAVLTAKKTHTEKLGKDSVEKFGENIRFFFGGAALFGAPFGVFCWCVFR